MWFINARLKSILIIRTFSTTMATFSWWSTCIWVIFMYTWLIIFSCSNTIKWLYTANVHIWEGQKVSGVNWNMETAECIMIASLAGCCHFGSLGRLTQLRKGPSGRIRDCCLSVGTLNHKARALMITCASRDHARVPWIGFERSSNACYILVYICSTFVFEGVHLAI